MTKDRIRELADRAGEYADFESGLCTDEFLKKFAELTILECAKFLDEKSDHDDFVAKVAPLLRKR